jgi:hypothetical protein
MSYTIKQTLLGVYNRPHTPLAPQGIVVHDTEGHNDSDEGNFNYFNGADRSASAHYFVDGDSISQFIPDNEQAWHACHSGNIRYLGMELCHEDDPTQFAETWKRGVWLVAAKCVQYGWDPHNQNQVMTHHMVTNRFHESNHTDPDSYFAQHGKNFDMFVADVVAQIEAIKGNPVAPTPASPVPLGGIIAQVEVIADKLNIRTGPGTSYNIIKTVPKGTIFNVTANVNDWHEVIVDDHTKGYAFGNNGTFLSLIKPSTPAPAPKPATRKLHLPASAQTWTVYKIDHPAVKADPANIAGQLAPARFGGLTYDIVDDFGGGVYGIITQSFGHVKIYAAPSTGATIS